MIENAPFCCSSRRRRPRFSGRKMLTTEPPSSGGSGSRLNVPRITFSISITDSRVPMNPASPPAADATTRLKLALVGRDEEPGQQPRLDQHERDEREHEVAGRARRRHQRRALRVTLGPHRIVGRARPPHRPALRHRRQERHHEHADRLAPDVRNRRQRHLPAVIRRRVAALPRHQRVHGFVDGGGEQEGNEPDETGSEIDVHSQLA